MRRGEERNRACESVFVKQERKQSGRKRESERMESYLICHGVCGYESCCPWPPLLICRATVNAIAYGCFNMSHLFTHTHTHTHTVETHKHMQRHISKQAVFLSSWIHLSLPPSLSCTHRNVHQCICTHTRERGSLSHQLTQWHTHTEKHTQTHAHLQG